jgi:hypothetical protein
VEKRFAKVVKNPKTGRTKTVKYGQAGKAKDGGDRIRPGKSQYFFLFFLISYDFERVFFYD